MADKIDGADTGFPAQMANCDVVHIASRVVRAIYGLSVSQAAGQGDGFPIEADLTRTKDALGDLVKIIDCYAVEPSLDCPESNGLLFFDIPPFPALDEVQNVDVKALMNRLKIMYVEMVNAQSGRLTTGFNPNDINRLKTYITSMQRLITDYIEQETPNDYPESVPTVPSPDAGKLGQ